MSQVFHYKQPDDPLNAAWVNSINSIVHPKMVGAGSKQGHNVNAYFNTKDPRSITLDFKKFPEMLATAVPGGLVYGNNGAWSTSAEIGGAPYLIHGNYVELLRSDDDSNVELLVNLLPLQHGNIYTLVCEDRIFNEAPEINEKVLAQLNKLEADAKAALQESIQNFSAVGIEHGKNARAMYQSQYDNVSRHFAHLRLTRNGEGLLAWWENNQLKYIGKEFSADDPIPADFAVFKIEPLGELSAREKFIARVVYIGGGSGGGGGSTVQPDMVTVKLVCSEETGCHIVEPIIGSFFLNSPGVPLPVSYDSIGYPLLTSENGGKYHPHQFVGRAYFNTAGTLKCETYDHYDPIRATWHGGEPYDIEINDWRPVGFAILHLDDDGNVVSTLITHDMRIRGEQMLYVHTSGDKLPLYLMQREPAISDVRCAVRHRQGNDNKSVSLNGLQTTYLNGTHIGLGDGVDDTYAHDTYKLYLEPLPEDYVPTLLRDPVDTKPVLPKSNRYGFSTKPFCIGNPDSFLPNLQWDGNIDILKILLEQEETYKKCVEDWLRMLYNSTDIFYESFTSSGFLFLEALEAALIGVCGTGADGNSVLDNCLSGLNNEIDGEIHALIATEYSNTVAQLDAQSMGSSGVHFPLVPTHYCNVVEQLSEVPLHTVAKVGTGANKEFWYCIKEFTEYPAGWAPYIAVDASIFQNTFNGQLNLVSNKNEIDAVFALAYLGTWECVTGSFNVHFNSYLREQYHLQYNELLLAINAAFRDGVYHDPNDLDGAWTGTFANYLAKTLLDVTENDIKDAIQKIYSGQDSGSGSGESDTPDLQQDEEFQRASLFIRQWCDLIYRPALEDRLFEQPPTFDNWDNVTLPVLFEPLIALPDVWLSVDETLMMYFDLTAPLDFKVDDNGDTVLSLYTNLTVEQVKNRFRQAVENQILVNYVTLFSTIGLNGGVLATALQDALYGDVYKHYTILLDDLYTPFLTEEKQEQLQNLIAGDGRYLELVQVLQSYTDSLADDVKKWMRALMADPRRALEDSTVAAPPYMYEILTPPVTTFQAVNVVTLSESVYSQLAAKSFDLFENQKDSLFNLYKQVVTLSMQQTMMLTDVPFAFNRPTAAQHHYNSESALNAATTGNIPAAGDTALVIDEDGLATGYTYLRGKWEKFDPPLCSSEEFYEKLWGRFADNFNNIFMPHFKGVARNVYNDFVQTYSRLYLEALVSVLLGTDTDMANGAYGTGVFWKLYAKLADSIVFDKKTFDNERFKRQFGDDVTLIDYLRDAICNHMADQQNKLPPNIRNTLNFRGTFGMLFRDHIPDEFHKTILRALDNSSFGLDWFIGGIVANDPGIQNFLDGYKPKSPSYPQNWTWVFGKMELPGIDKVVFDYRDFETKTRDALYDVFQALWEGTGSPSQKSIWDVLMQGFIDLINNYFMPIVRGDVLYLNDRYWPEIEGNKWMLVLYNSMSEHFRYIFQSFFTERFLLDKVLLCRIEPVPPSNWELTLAEEKAQRHNLLAFCPTLDPNEILVPGEMVNFVTQAGTYSLPAVDLYNRPVYDHEENQLYEQFSWRYALVTPPDRYTVDIAGTAECALYVYESINALVHEKQLSYEEALEAYRVALKQWEEDPFNSIRPTFPDVNDPRFKDAYEQIIRAWETDEKFTIDTKSPWQNIAVSIKQNSNGAMAVRNPYGVVNDMKWPHLRGGFYKTDAMGRKYLCGFRCESIPYGNAIKRTSVVGITYTETDSCAPVFEPDRTVLVRTHFNDRTYLMPAQTTQWTHSLQMLDKPPIPGSDS
jgi:hypothetical protein